MAPLTPLFQRLAKAPALQPLQRRLLGEHPQKSPFFFEHAASGAHPLLVAFLATSSSSSQTTAALPARRIWLVTPSPKSAERFAEFLPPWIPNTWIFPEETEAPHPGAIADPEAHAARLALLDRLREAPKESECILLTLDALQMAVPSPKSLRQLERRLQVGQSLDRDALLQELQDHGYEPTPQLSERGQFAVRGGILDLFTPAHRKPLRLEFFGNELESIRYFDLDAQTSVESLDECTLLLAHPSEGDTCAVASLPGPEDLVLFSDAWSDPAPEGLPDLPGSRRGFLLCGVRPASHASVAVENFSGAFFENDAGRFGAGDFIVDELKRERLFEQLASWHAQGWLTVLFFHNEGEAERLREILPAVSADTLLWIQGGFPGGLLCPDAKLAILTDSDLLGRLIRPGQQHPRKLAEALRHPALDFSELSEDDLVVHLEHGIARFEGLRQLMREGVEEQVLVLRFANEARLYLPLEQSGLVSRYVGIGKRNPPLSELGDGKWAKACKNAERSIFEYAGRMLRLHAERETCTGYAMAPDTVWQREFEDTFPYDETPDQLTAIAATKADMESQRPMDRLICGDVGFGKTEVAIRAAFKAVMGGKQVALLVPTTVLAEQHYRNFKERMSAFPVQIGMLSRFRTAAQQRETLEGLASGSVDIVIGTHRLLSTSVEFKDLGLVIIDEEQRFGVLHKDRLKERFRLVDQLTLSATPIPRTLYLSLMGAKDMSSLETPPPNRIPVETFICPYDERIIRDAIQRELHRGGQVYFLHNRIETIGRLRDRLAQLVPKARTVIGHGQMNEHELEEVMHQFVSGQADVLISTTIIESGLDIPNANTILIDRADRFGLADLYQLRGRVGRSGLKAYAYLLLPRAMLTVGEARKRIQAIKQYSSLGAGFKIALRDLEIRGAGNILGTQQSGHIVAIGFDLYCSLLRQAIARQKGERPPDNNQAHLRLDFVATKEGDFLQGSPQLKAPAFLPSAFITDPKARIAAYRSLNSIASPEELLKLRSQWQDRFGSRLPEAVENLLQLTQLRLVCAQKRISNAEVKELKVMLQRGGDFVLIGNRFPRLPAHQSPARQLAALLKLVQSL
jgi:transcription-repair coupling factor (superfamily II helicase)